MRDLDVVRVRLFEDGADDPSTASLRNAFDENHRLARRTLADALADRRRALLRDKLREAARHPWLKGEISRPARKRLHRRLRALWQKLENARDAVRASASDEAYHSLRKRGKDLRLALEIAAPELGRRRARERLDQALGRLVSLLGTRQDAVVAARVAAALAEGLGSNSPGLLAAVHALAGRQRPVVDCADRDFADAWRSVRRRARSLLEA